MPENSLHIADTVVVDVGDLTHLFKALSRSGFVLVGPTVREEAIVYDRLNSVDDLPRGWTDEQSPGKYRLNRRTDESLFGFNVGPQSWKMFLHPPLTRLWQCKRDVNGLQVIQEKPDDTKYALIGVRACELHAIAILDKVFTGGPYVDPEYKSRRDSLFVVAVNCGQAGGTCFCTSMNTGPKAASGYDVALTEILKDGSHYFVVEIGTEAGARVMAEIPHRRSDAEDLRIAEDIVAETARHMGRTLDTNGIKELLYRNYEHPRWEDVANRCLTCANCTMVCPTCFCTTVEDVTDLAGGHAERWRKWDSCFTMDFSYIHGGCVRSTPKSRYRQWMTHKLATWIDQFGESGCVGCGRCITWCPVGIDITAEAQAIRDNESEPRGST